MSAPCIFQRSVELPLPVEAVYRFHADPHNIPRISPPWQRTRKIEAAPEARVGEEFLVEVSLFGLLPLRWRGVWKETRPPGLLVDEARQSPFAYWQHQHRFEAVGPDRTRMTDHVTYRLPGGWLGKLGGETFGRLQFALMFGDRHARTLRWAQREAAGGGRS